MDNIYLPIIEALIFSAEEPLTLSEISKAIKEIDGEEVSDTEIELAVDTLNEKYKNFEISINILRVSNGFLFATKPEYAKYVGYLSSEKSSRRLSQAALETLAIIAYKQPITKPEIEAIRGVNSDYMINTLLEKNLITIKGRAETIGRPLLYVTTDTFLIYFGLNKLSDLPKPREIEEIMQDADFQEQKRKLLMNQIEEIVENETNQESEPD
ncbi:MAG TPA: SMC-Scp complex subunit ScpB [Melioribacteraceae bacterium]|nr:SMC-Scp complex subunit ScpB [Melioribacteraceae bacterium]